MKTNFTYRALLALLFLSQVIHAQTPINKVSETVDAKIIRLSEAFIKQAHIPGLSIAVSKNKEVIYAKGFGYADLEKSIKMDPSIRIRTASVAKVITATALGRLVSEGKLDLDVPIIKYVPYINNTYAQLTSRQLAGHTAGLEHRPKGERYKKKQYNTIQETVTLMKAPLLFKPDTDYKYSTHAFNLLAAVIEGSSGKNYIEYMQENIFKPLGMTNTFAENINTLTEKDAKLYYIKNGKLRKERTTNGSYKIPGASFRSTPTDLVKMMNAYDNDFINKDIVADMFKSHKLIHGKKTNVGIAWRSSIDPFENRVIEHAGNWLGARTVVVYYPEENLSVSLMVNASCQVLIEETAHIFAQAIRTQNAEDSSINITNQSIELNLNSNNNEEQYKGSFSFIENNGLLKTESKGFLKSNPIYYLGTKDNYTLATSFGLLYLNLSNKGNLEGKLYTYFNRNSSNPKKGKPIAEFKTITNYVDSTKPY